MEIKRDTALERALCRAAGRMREFRLPFVAAMLFGLAAHMFAFSNKLVNADDIESLFGKGATITSGRWGLEAVKLIFPDASMPWLYGLVSLVLLSASVCLIVHIFEIKEALPRLLVAGLVTSFPSQTGTFCFMFTSSAYALAFFMAVLAVCLFCRGGRRGAACAVVLLALSLGIYQAYIALAASLFILRMLMACLDGREWKNVLAFGLRALGVLILSVALYAAITLAVFHFTGAEFNDYVRDNANDRGLLGRVRMAYDFFVYYFTYREYALITGEASRWMHLLLIAVCALALAVAAISRARQGEGLSAALMLVCVGILPLGINCMYLAMAKSSVHTLVIYSFVALYVLAAILLERVLGGGAVWRRAARDAAYAALTLALVSNIYFANETYLKLYLQYEQAYSFYSMLLTRVQSVEGFDEECKLALVDREQTVALTRYDEIDLGYLTGPSRDLVNIYSRENFIRRYLGSDIPLASPEEVKAVERTDEFTQMGYYPYANSVRRIGNIIAVRLA